MALARCEDCGRPEPPAFKEKYCFVVDPLGYPNTALVCGRKGCSNPAHVWMDAVDAMTYQNGQRVIDLPTDAAKVKVQNNGRYIGNPPSTNS